MNSPNEPSKESALPTQDEARRVNVLMEKIYSEFRTFGESLSIVRARVDRIEPEMHEVKEAVVLLKSAVRSHTDAIHVNTEAIQAMRVDLNQINHRLEVVEVKVANHPA